MGMGVGGVGRVVWGVGRGVWGVGRGVGGVGRHIGGVGIDEGVYIGGWLIWEWMRCYDMDNLRIRISGSMPNLTDCR